MRWGACGFGQLVETVGCTLGHTLGQTLAHLCFDHAELRRDFARGTDITHLPMMHFLCKNGKDFSFLFFFFDPLSGREEMGLS